MDTFIVTAFRTAYSETEWGLNMSNITEIRHDIIEMQKWAAQNPTENERLLTLLLQVRGEVERILLKTT